MSVLLFVLCSAALTQCTKGNATDPFDAAAHRDSIDAWHARRVRSLTSPTGWLNLAGLYWLKEGINTFGSDPSNDLVFPEGKIAARAGSFVLRSGRVTLELVPGVVVTRDSLPVKSEVIYYPDSAYFPLLQCGTLQWFVIRRDKALGIRLRDLASRAVEGFAGIERFPVDPVWRIPATVEIPDEPRTVSITNVIGQTTEEPSPGTVVFTFKGGEYRIDALDGGPGELYLIFGDKTNAVSTYPAGRYLYIPRPDSTGRTFIDFNKAYNPPCAFTEFATCPLPPRQNVLEVEITAGEKAYHMEGHL